MAWAYSGIPGRKTVAWFTSGFPVLEQVPDAPPLFGKPGPPSLSPSTSAHHFGSHIAPMFQQTFTALSRANVVLYPIDITGLPEDRPWTVWNSLIYGTPCGINSTRYQSFPNAWDGCPDADVGSGWLDRIGLKEMSGATGGKPCDSGHNIGHCVDRATSEGGDYYLLGFYVPRQTRDVGWHELKVTAAGDHGEVRARSGYFLESTALSFGAPTRDMDSAIAAALEYTGIAFSVDPGAHPSGSNAPIVFKVTVPGHSIVRVPGEDKLSFDVVAVGLSDRGTPLHGTARVATINIPEQKIQLALVKGWHLVDSIAGNNRIAAVKVLVRDNATGKIGSVVFPVPGGGAAL
jgi:hypothetical protein